MKLIKYITDYQIDNELKEVKTSNEWNVRLAVRAVLLDDQKRIALMRIAEYNVYKLPGGGVDEEEDLATAFIREIKEETGCEAQKLMELGMTIEKRDKWKLFQISHCFLAKVTKVSTPSLTEEELTTGFSLKWIETVDKAIELVSKGKSTRYDDLYIMTRDSAILKRAKDLLR